MRSMHDRGQSICHLLEILPEIVETALPPWMIGLSNYIEALILRLQLIEELPGASPVSTAIDVNHNQRRRLVSIAGINAVDSSFKQIGKIGPVIGELAVWP